jgi:hypothetical protein
MAAQAADQQLRQLTAQLSEERLLLAAAANLSVALVALYEHVKMACSSGWSIPEVGLPPEVPRKSVLQAWRERQAAGGPPLASSSTGSSNSDANSDGSSSSSASGASPIDSGSAVTIQGMFPYWLPKHGDIGGKKTVLNDVYLDSSMLLTGPNMAGERQGRYTKSVPWVCRPSGLPRHTR